MGGVKRKREGRKKKTEEKKEDPQMNKKKKVLQFVNSVLPNLRLHCSPMPNILVFRTSHVRWFFDVWCAKC